MSISGRKKASFTREQLENCIAKNMTFRQICYSLNAGDLIIRKKMKEWGITRRSVPKGIRY